MIMGRTNIHLVDFDKTSFFESDIYFARRIKEIYTEEGGIDIVFSNSFEKFPILKKYCSRYDIETKKLDFSDLESNYYAILNYSAEHREKKNLAYLLKNKEKEEFYNLFRKNISFNTFVL